MPEALPLATLLSPALVAFTVEFDNEAESRLVHRTTEDSGPEQGPWLVSQVMWANVLRHIPDEGIGTADLHERARTKRDSLAGLRRWGYVRVETAPPHGSDPVVHLRSSARRARAVWEPLGPQIEARWKERFGHDVVGGLRDGLTSLLDHIDLAFPNYLPIVFPAKGGRTEPGAPRSAGGETDPDGHDLSVLLSQALQAFTLEFEGAMHLSLAMCANTLRVADCSGVAVRDLPRLTGVSKEANQMCLGFFERHGHLVVEPDATRGRGKMVRLTPAGQATQGDYHRLVHETEERWRERFGPQLIADIRQALDAIVGPSPTATQSPLFEGLDPLPGGWRSRIRRPETLPHSPMVLHRGGFPDGS